MPSLGRVLVCVAGLWSFALVGCGGDDAVTPPGGGTDGGRTGRCTTSAECPSDQTCHPYSNVCVRPGNACTTHADCPDGTYCESSIGACLGASTGTPCMSDVNCSGTCSGGVCGCAGLAQERHLEGGPLDVYFVFDRTGSMGEDCDYVHGDSPPVSSKACFATYAMSNYLINVTPQVDTRLAFQFMSLALDDCDGVPYSTPLTPLTQLPVPATDPLIQAISNENFAGGLGTHIEGALRGIASFTANNETPGRTMIGVLMTDGDPNGCNEDVGALSGIISAHLAATGIRTFIIGMEGATDSNLEQLGVAGGADPHPDFCGSVSAPCHYWNVGNGSGDAIASALRAIVGQASPLPCSFDVLSLEAPAGESRDFNKVNVNLTENGVVQTIGRVSDAGSCPTDIPAWYYDDPAAPTMINLCPLACDTVQGAAQGARVTVVLGCQDTVIVPR